MKITRLAGIAALLAAGVTQAQAQDIKLTGVLFEFWQTQMLDSNLRNNATAASAGPPPSTTASTPGSRRTTSPSSAPRST